MALVKLKGGMSLVYNNIRYYFDKMNLALFSAAVDVVVVEGPDGTLRSTPFLVCFSTYNCLTNPHERQISISINGEPVEGVEMSLGGDGPQARFVGEDLPSERLRALHLKYGSNTAEFSIVTGIRGRGTACCSCNIHLLKWTDRLVISDIDGTITKSDVLGHIIPAIGGSWTQASVADLYTRIKGNGYQLVYLSSRAMGLSSRTKGFLENIMQDTHKLPSGPVLLSPLSILGAFKMEVIDRRPEEFKITCLTGLKSLFPDDVQPFFAGFGNRPTDVEAYKAVGVPLERVFIVNPSNTVMRGDQMQCGALSPIPTSSYVTMANERVDYLFPCIGAGGTSSGSSGLAFWGQWDTQIGDDELEQFKMGTQ